MKGNASCLHVGKIGMWWKVGRAWFTCKAWVADLGVQTTSGVRWRKSNAAHVAPILRLGERKCKDKEDEEHLFCGK